MSSSDTLPVAGWREWVALPDWGIRRIRAKLDTGARTSAIHVSRIEEREDGRLRFQVVVREHPIPRTRWIEADAVRDARVKPSHGQLQDRKVVRTRMRLGLFEQEIEIGLVCRQGMVCRMLLGREALAGRLLVDSASIYLLTGNGPEKAP
jgi:hypothetical protein